MADMVTDLTAARTMLRLAASKIDQQAPDLTVYCAMAKRLATDVGFQVRTRLSSNTSFSSPCVQVCNDALQMFGGYGYLKDYPLNRYLRDVRVHQILEGTNGEPPSLATCEFLLTSAPQTEIMKHIIARSVLSDEH